MNLLTRCLLLTIALIAPLAAYAKPPAASAPPATAPAEPPATSSLRVTCEGDDIGAEVTVNGKFKGECPLDMKVAPGILTLRVEKKGTTIERFFEQEIRIGDGVAKKVEVVMSSWIKDANGCKFSNPQPSPNETITWTGGCKDGYGDGPGKLSWFANSVFSQSDEGVFRKGVREGHAISVTADGDRYEGEVKNGAQNGHGITTLANGDRHEGEYKNGLKNGYGITTYAPGNCGRIICQRKPDEGKYENGQFVGK